MPMEPKAEKWFALKVFYNKIGPIKEEAETAGWPTFIPVRVEEEYTADGLKYVEKQLIRSLLFIHCTPEWLIAFKHRHFSDLMFYADLETGKPAPIPDKEMKSFMILTSGNRKVEYLGETLADFRRGEHVRVTGGIYKGAEGWIKRVKQDRKFLVAVTGVAVVAVSYIHPEYLEKIETE